MYSSIEIANYFIVKGIEKGLPVTPMKVQKLVYFAHGWYLASFGKPLINESIEAWKYGPVIPTIYHEFKHFGNNPIDEPSLNIFGIKPIVRSKEITDFLDVIWETYSSMTAIQLSNITHEKDSPWYTTLKDFLEQGFDIPKSKDINEKVLADHFRQKLMAA